MYFDLNGLFNIIIIKMMNKVSSLSRFINMFSSAKPTSSVSLKNEYLKLYDMCKP